MVTLISIFQAALVVSESPGFESCEWSLSGGMSVQRRGGMESRGRKSGKPTMTQTTVKGRPIRHESESDWRKSLASTVWKLSRDTVRLSASLGSIRNHPFICSLST